jgi:hypothetical protein
VYSRSKENACREDRKKIKPFYSDEFRDDAVRLLKSTSRPLHQVAVSSGLILTQDQRRKLTHLDRTLL